MSYNITKWKIRELHLELPLTFDFQHWLTTQPDRTEKGYENVGKRWCLEEREPIAVQVNLTAQTWKLDILGNELSGDIVEDRLMTLAMEDWTGDCSGHLYSDILLPLFKNFEGTLVALVVWEGGDTVANLSIVDGVVSEEKLGE
jgi:hypothetical protein